MDKNKGKKSIFFVVAGRTLNSWETSATVQPYELRNAIVLFWAYFLIGKESRLNGLY